MADEKKKFLCPHCGKEEVTEDTEKCKCGFPILKAAADLAYQKGKSKLAEILYGPAEPPPQKKKKSESAFDLLD